jgi:hypothetical protein
MLLLLASGGEAVSTAAPAAFWLLWSCKSRLVHKISFVWSLLYFEFMA